MTALDTVTVDLEGADEDIVAAGMRYLTAGVAPLVPLVGKNPRHYGTDWQRRGITDPVQWAEVVAADSRYTNIGWCQGHGTVALDFDCPDRATEDMRAVARQGAKNPTRKGRGHRIFATDGAYGASTRGFPAKGWGEVRGRGGQIVIWGPHPEDPGAFYRYDETQVVPPAPAELIGWLAGATEYATSVKLDELVEALRVHTEATRPKALDGPRTRMAHLAEVLTGASTDPEVKAARHDNLIDLACWATREALAGLYPLSEAHAAVGDWWQSLGLPPDRARTDLGYNEFTDAWCWALGQARSEPERIAAIRDPLASLTEPPAGVDPDTGEVTEPTDLDRLRIDWSGFWSVDRTAEEWLVEPVIPRGRNVSITARHKTGKSEFVLGVIAPAVLGRATLHRAAGAPLRVLYLDYEMTEADVQERLSAMGFGPGDDLEPLAYLLHPPLPPLDEPAGGEAVHRLAREHRAELVVVDTFSRAISGEEDSNDTVRRFYSATVVPLKRDGIAAARLDHTGHGDQTRARGASSKGDDVDLGWLLARSEVGFTLTAGLTRLSWVPGRLDVRRTEDPLTLDIGPRSWPAGTAECAAVLDRLRHPLDAGYRGAEEALRGLGETFTRATVRAAVKYRKARTEEAGIWA